MYSVYLCPRKFLRENLLISCLDINHNLERYRVIFILTQLAIETSDLISGPDMWQLRTALMLIHIENASCSKLWTCFINLNIRENKSTYIMSGKKFNIGSLFHIPIYLRDKNNLIIFDLSHTRNQDLRSCTYLEFEMSFHCRPHNHLSSNPPPLKD